MMQYDLCLYILINLGKRSRVSNIIVCKAFVNICSDHVRKLLLHLKITVVKTLYISTQIKLYRICVYIISCVYNQRFVVSICFFINICMKSLIKK